MASSPPAPPRFPLLDGLRAIAALSVLLYHTATVTTFNAANDVLGPFTARLNAGVAIFFVLSGFLLYRPWVGARVEGTRPPRLARYARARLLRILPGVLAGPDRPVGVAGPQRHASRATGGSSTGCSSRCRRPRSSPGLGPAWTLSVELSFYAVLPLYALGAARWLAGRPAHAQRRAELAALALLALASVAARTLRTRPIPTGRSPTCCPACSCGSRSG
jgi:peptidoglycan/LPS O-acetylase OafA/YrhL